MSEKQNSGRARTGGERRGVVRLALFGSLTVVIGGAVGVIAGALSYHSHTTTVVIKEPRRTVTVRATQTVRVKEPYASPTSPAAQAALPVMVTDGWTGVRPSAIYFSGDAGNVVTNITWLSWTPAVAVGSGKSGIQACVPNCATGPVTYVPTTVTLSNPANGHFAFIQEVRSGQAYSASYPSAQWPRAS